MDLNLEYVELEQFVATHFPPRRPPGHPDGQLSLGELGPAVHHFRHRAEIFLLASGELQKEEVEDLELNRMMPDVILEKLRNARDYWSIQKTTPVNPEKKPTVKKGKLS